MGDPDKDLERFYARNPQLPKRDAPATPDAPDMPARSPQDMGSLTIEQTLQNLDPTRLGLLDYHGEVMPMLRKRLVWDMVPDDMIKTHQQSLDVTPASDEGDGIEQVEAHARRQLLLPLLPLINSAALTAGEIAVRAKMLNSDEDVSGGALAVLASDPEMVALVVNAIQGVVANLLDLGLLTYGAAIK